LINRIIREEKEQICLEERVVWGIWAPRRLQAVYKMTASELRVPISVLVDHILRQWFADNQDTILGDKQKQRWLRDFLSRKYLSDQTDEWPSKRVLSG
jgi:hypothetical protein